MDPNATPDDQNTAAAPADTPQDTPPTDELELPLMSPASRRMAMMESVAASSREARELPGDGEAPAPQGDASDPGATDKTGEQLAQQLAADDKPVDLAGQTVRVKVDGHERDVPMAELVRNYQVSTAADQRMQQATAMLRAAQQTTQPQPDAPQGTVATVPATPDLSAVKQTMRDKVKGALGKVFAEGEEAAAGDLTEAVLEAIQGALPAHTTSPSIDTQAIANAAVQQIEQNSAVKGFLNTYKRIAENPYLQAAADDALARVQQVEPNLPLPEALKRAGDQVYRDFGYQVETPAVPQGQPTPASRADVLAAKKQGLAPVPIRTGSAMSVQKPPRNSEATRVETIAQMAAARRPPAPTIQ